MKLIKNWNIQEKNKIKDPMIKKNMKTRMKKMLTKIVEKEFKELHQAYFQEAKEDDFNNYLFKYLHLFYKIIDSYCYNFFFLFLFQILFQR